MICVTADEWFEAVNRVANMVSLLLDAMILEDLEDGDSKKVVDFADALENVDMALHKDDSKSLQDEQDRN